MALGLQIIRGAHLLRACYLMPVVFSQVLATRVEAGSKCCLHMVLKRSSESCPCIAHLLPVFTSMTVTGKLLDVHGGS